MNRVALNTTPATTPARPRPQTVRAEESTAPVSQSAARQQDADENRTTLTSTTAELQADGAP
jgi:hypothetical protein